MRSREVQPRVYKKSIGDGMTLDIMAKNLYDDKESLLQAMRLVEEVMEFTVGGLVGGISIRHSVIPEELTTRARRFTAEGQQKD